MSLSMVAASIRLLVTHETDYSFIVNFVFGSVLLYFLSTTVVFHQYRFEHHRLKVTHLTLFLVVLGIFFVIDELVKVPTVTVVGELTLFFILYAALTTKKISHKTSVPTKEV
jgi:membrane protein YdbS with pleckstrin-like domain